MFIDSQQLNEVYMKFFKLAYLDILEGYILPESDHWEVFET